MSLVATAVLSLVVSTGSIAVPTNSDVPVTTVSTDAVQEVVDMLFTSATASRAADRDRIVHIEHERAVQDCMAAAGFVYVPLPTGGAAADITLRTELGDEAFVAEYGYGISTLVEAEEERGAVNGMTLTDPNEAVRESLSADQLVRYDDARWGGWLEGVVGEDGRPVPADFDAGCQGAARRVYSPARLPHEASMEIGAVDAAIAADERVVAVEAAWSVCMARSGWDLAAVAQASDAVRAMMEPIWRTTSYGDRQITTVDGRVLTISVPMFDQAALASVQREELAIAGADWACRMSTDYNRILDSVANEHRREFVARWLDRIDVAQP